MQLTVTNLQLFPDSLNEKLVAVFPRVYQSLSFHFTTQASKYIFQFIFWEQIRDLTRRQHIVN